MRSILGLVLIISSGLQAGAKPVYLDVRAQCLDAARGAWVACLVEAKVAAAGDQTQVKVPGLKAGKPAQLRIEFANEPDYRRWKKAEQAAGGLRWQAVKALLDEAGEGPVVFQSAGAWPKQGPARVEIGVIEKGSRRFARYAVAHGEARGGVFTAKSLTFDSALAAGAWKLMAPWARQRLLDKP